jgi:hypothetical protein
VQEDYKKLRREALDRAEIASKLVKNEQHFPDVVKAIRGKHKRDFVQACADVGIEDQDLIEHMWKVIAAAHGTVYGQEAASPIW